jgi:alkanesulfonate monooxygenase SsuD/methylene tetrahydromethanopterin reductase-like flavin-dependent oxidoreductase (luciferase family)
MEIAVGLPVGVVAGDSEVVFDWIARAEAGPFSGVAALDRVVSTGYEPLAVLAAAAGATHRVRLHAAVIIGPTRETTLLARQTATVDALSGGRLSLGFGVGARRDDYAASGQDFGGRGRRLEAQLEILRRLWSGRPLSEEIGRIGPPAARPGGPEVLIGGYVEAVARRVATWGDGYVAPGGGTDEAVLAQWGRVLGAWSAAGRAGSPRFVWGGYFALGPHADDHARAYIEAQYGWDPATATRRLAGIPTAPAALRALLERRGAQGVDEFILRPCAPEIGQLDRLADLVGGGLSFPAG